ncbi:Na+-transporting NADH:ubiquinone oxidoreductase subunit B [Desulfocicer vacuolatum DSM 3385]|uniref:Na(+)-translocating NADH-quinone reductase subunit B n=1 Tax=Desulfocicer vacuolatum DSM 3385 TaxID=1121400 RepID=A0A1W2ESL8_9BACT|nr:NADH:ubiquinone reductase (Na(+)-transporting) subunit B [Desulfocicer vacuolatum]SMD12635.1 Na+-transporting NADH:ubiquinone oxidoreductase subunit B [Desulfocicer vacuolatum DSM 3385]
MNPLKSIFKKTDPYFQSQGRFSRFKGIYLATRTFFFLPSPVTTTAPHVRDHIDLKRFMSFVILALLPVTLFGMFNVGYQYHGGNATWIDMFSTGAGQVLPIILVSYGVGFFWEILFATVRGHDVTEGLLVTGLLFPLTLPPTIPLWQVALGISFGVVMGKEVFGGTGRNLLNPALTARAFVFFSYPVSMSGNNVWQLSHPGVDALSGATALSLGGTGEIIQETILNAGFSLDRLFFGFHPGSIGETSALLCFVGAVFLMVTRVASFRIILGGIAGVILTSLVFMVLPGPKDTWFSAGPLYHLFSGGFALGISFMATDPVSAPGTNSGRWIYGFFIGFFTVLLRSVNPAYVEGVMLSILFMNIFSPLIDHVTLKITAARRIPNV